MEFFDILQKYRLKGWIVIFGGSELPQYIVSAIFLEKISEGKIGITNPQFFDSVRSVNFSRNIHLWHKRKNLDWDGESAVFVSSHYFR